MSASNIIYAKTDLSEGVQKHRLGRLFAANDKQAHTINVEVLQDGAAADLSGQSAVGYFIRGDEATVTINGTISGNVATITLPSSCYAKPGYFSMIIKATGDVSTAIFWADGTITRTTTDIIVDPEHIVPSLEELLAQIAAIEAATAAANTAANRANSAASGIEELTVSVTSGNPPSADVTDVDGHKHIAFVLPKGDKGDPGSIDNVSAQTIPMSQTDSTTVAEAIAASGKVNTVAGVQPDSNKNVPLKAADIPMSATDSTKIPEAVTRNLYSLIEVTLPSVSGDSLSYTAAGITADHELVQDGFAYLSNPEAVLGDITLTTGTNSITVSGTFVGTTDIKATFAIKGKKVTATALVEDDFG